eukprot:1080744-Prymnesium_polylepis.1
MLSALVAEHRGPGAEQLRECSNVLTHGQGVSQIRSKRSKPPIGRRYLVSGYQNGFCQRIGTHNMWHKLYVCARSSW